MIKKLSFQEIKIAINSYTQAQKILLNSFILKENSTSKINEKFLQILWNEKVFSRKLSSIQGDEIIIHDFGLWNDERGADFKNALCSINKKKVLGDIEIDLKVSNWISHKHKDNPDFNKLILHCVWENFLGTPPHHYPIVNLKKYLPISIEKLKRKYSSSPYLKKKQFKTIPHIKNSHSCKKQLKNIFRAAGFFRFKQKINSFQSLIKQKGFSEAFYIKFFEALGYKSNKENFYTLTQIADFNSLKKLSSNKERKAFLWGMSGLLPDLSQSKIICEELKPEVQALWKQWSLLRASHTEIPNWTYKSSRPANYPERRLVAGIKFLEQFNYNLEKFFQQLFPLVHNKKKFFNFCDESLSFNHPWENYYNFNLKASKPIKLIGKARVNELIINVFLPFFASLLTDKQEQIKSLIFLYYQDFPKLSINKKLMLARFRFFENEEIFAYINTHAIDQQGMIQLTNDCSLENFSNKHLKDFWHKLGIQLFE